MKNYQKFTLLFFPIYLLISTILYSKLTIPKGDEVHYLITAESIVKDGDLYLENNYSGDITGKFGYLELDKHTVKGRGGHEILGHGLTIFPVIIAPFYFIAGKLGVSLFLSLICILLFKQAIKLCLSITNNAPITWIVCLSLFITLPLVQFSFLVFPEMLGGLLIIFSLNEALSRKKLSSTSAFLIGLMPWVHVRFLTVSIFFVLFWFIKQFRKPTKSLLLPLILFLLYFLTNYLLFGSFNINKSFMDAGSAYSGNIISNIINLLIDRQYGLIPNNPVFLLAIPGMFFWFRKNRQSALVVLLLIAAGLLPFINSTDWHGGFAPPSRYITAIIPVVIPAVVLVLINAKTLLVKTIWFLGFMWGYMVYLINLLHPPNHGYLYKDGLTPYLSELSVRTRLYLYYLFPGYFPDEKITVLHWLWMALILLISLWILVKPTTSKGTTSQE